MLPNLGFSLQAKYDRPLPQVLQLLQKAGFSAVSPVWALEAELSTITESGMVIQSLHAPPRGIPLLWQPDEAASRELLETMLRCIDRCAQFQIPTLVVHGWQGLHYTFPTQPLYFDHFDRILDYARAQGIRVAFENLEGEEYLKALMDRYPDAFFCWDCGHEHCYPHKLDFLQEFGQRLIMTHLNDNLGTRDPAGLPAAPDDLHYLPMDGNLDWDRCICRLAGASRQDTLNFELKIATRDPGDDRYSRMPLEQFIAEAGYRARKIAQMYAAVVKP